MRSEYSLIGSRRVLLFALFSLLTSHSFPPLHFPSAFIRILFVTRRKPHICGELMGEPFMVNRERLEIGEKSFVSSILAVLATEAALTIVTNGTHFTWIGLLLGVFGFCLVLFLANRLYAGSRQAQMIALAWVGFQVVYAALALGLMMSSAHGAETAAQIGAPMAWPVVLKAVVYLVLGWVLLRMPSVRDFFAEKRGEQVTHEVAAPVVAAPDAGQPLALTADQTAAASGLAKNLYLVVGALIALGALQILAGLRLGNIGGLLIAVQGLLTLVLGIGLGGPSNEVAPLTSADEQTRGQLTSALGSFLKFFKLQVLVTLALAVIVVVRFLIALGVITLS